MNIIPKENDLFFAKTMETAIIPTKRDEDVGYDVYIGDRSKTLCIYPNSTITINTGIATAYTKEYTTIFFDKSGLGKEGIKICGGVFDSGYRGPYYANLANLNGDKFVVFTAQNLEEVTNLKYFDLDKNEFTNNLPENYIEKQYCIIKDINKAITQILVLPVPKMNVRELSYEELKNISSERGIGWAGSSGK